MDDNRCVMTTEIDHVFVCCSVGAPEADELGRLGLREGKPNTHPGQGTACRRFLFDNTYLELFWVSDPTEAQSAAVRPVRLWDRWYHRVGAACPFGIILRADSASTVSVPPFPIREYRPSYFPPDVALGIARDTPLSEPALFYFTAGGGSWRRSEREAHDIPLTEMTGLTIWGPLTGPPSLAATAVQALGIVAMEHANHYLMALDFNHRSEGEQADLRPTLPLILRW
jgi:hypothetical protein